MKVLSQVPAAADEAATSTDIYAVSLNREYWDIVKGIGALTIVLGHSCYFASSYVYLFHLALFFFVSGYLYTEHKYGDRPFLCLANRLKNMWPKYVVYASAFVLLHNLFLEISVIINQPRYGLLEMAAGIGNALVFAGAETMGGALWFVPVLVFSTAIFAGIVWFGRRVSSAIPPTHTFIHNAVKYVSVAILSLIAGAIGVILNTRGISLNYHIHTAFLVIPLYAVAYFLRVFCKDIGKILKWYLAIPAALVLYAAVQRGWRIELSAEMIIGPVRFYAISLAGIYLCMYLAKLLQKLPYIKAYFAWIGRQSFDIMALHFLCIKLVDIVYALCIHESDPQVYGQFVCAYSENCWFYYALLGTALPALVGVGAAKMKKLFKNLLPNG